MITLFNKKSSKALFILFSLFFSLAGKSQDLIWDAYTYSYQDGYSRVRSIVTDSKGNIYSTGDFRGTVDFDPGPNNYNLTALPLSNTFTDSFILKLDKDKNFIWAKQISSYGSGTSIILDKNENIIITGLAGGTQLDLNPDPIGQYIINEDTLHNNGTYIIKLDPNGNFIFGNYYLQASGKESTLDNEGNIITTGVFNTNVDFDAGSNVYNLNLLRYDIFVLKNTQSGAFVWAKSIGDAGYDSPISLVCDNLNNIIIKGTFEYNIKFSNINYTSSRDCNFICKIGPNGQELWLKQLEPTNRTSSNEDKSVITDYSNNIYFTSKTDDPTIYKVQENGNYIWHNTIFGDERQEVNSIDLDSDNNLYLSVFVNGKTFINNTCNQVFPNKNTYKSYGGLLLKFDKNGKYINFKNTIENGYSLQCDFENNILIGGGWSNNQIGYNLKYSPCTSNSPEGENNQYFCASTNPRISDLKPCSDIINWYDSQNSTTPLAQITPLINGNIYYAAYNESCAGITRLAVKVNINPSVNLPIITNSVFCKKDNPKLSDITVIGSNLKWYDNSIGGNIIIGTTLLQNNTTYFVTQSETLNGCESIRIPVIPNIKDNTLTATSLQTFCIQQNATLNNITITGQNIKWYDAQTNGSLLANSSLLQNGITYYGSQTINGCESERVPVLVQIQSTQAPDGNSIQSFCSSQNPNLNTISITGTAIKWYDSPTNETLLANTTSLQNGITYFASQTENSCESISRLAVKVNLITSLPSNNYQEMLCDDLNDGKEIVNLSTYNTNLITNTTGYTFSYYSTQNGAENELAANKIPTFTNYQLALGSNKIYVRINSNTPCYAVAILDLTVAPKPIITIADTVPICENSAITINAGSNNNTYVWSTGETTSSIIASNPGNYWVTATTDYDIFSCSMTKNFIVKKSNKPTIKSIETKDWTDNQNTITIFVGVSGDFEYSLDGTNYQDSNEFDNLFAGTYTVSVRDKNGCGLVSDKAYLLMYPKYFTPNGDGYNDTWSIKASENETNISVKIFDRYGKLIKNILQNQSWDGTINGQNLPADDYWFVATLTNGKEYKGHFSLKR